VADSLSKVLEGYRPGYALPGVVYKDPAVYELEIRHIMLKAWHYAGHHSMVRERGDYTAVRASATRRWAASRASPAATTAGPTVSMAR
jgi:hypothetical protein